MGREAQKKPPRLRGLVFSWRRRRDSRARFADPHPSLASSVGRIPKNVPLARFPNGIPPHRFESPGKFPGYKKPPRLRGLIISWRRRRDSNPRYPGCGQNGFRDRRIQPLCHPSAWGVGLEPLIRETRRSALLFSGGEMGIRTPDTLLGHTRFPIVLLRPARTSLRIANCSS